MVRIHVLKNVLTVLLLALKNSVIALRPIRVLRIRSEAPNKMKESDENIPNIEELLSNRELFNNFVYTPFSEALTELWKRREDSQLNDCIMKLLNNDVPEPFLNKVRMVLLRYLITPNYEILRFLHIATETENFEPLLCEFPRDKFVPSNASKRFLGKLTFFMGWDHFGKLQAERFEIIDFESANNKSITDIKTLWGQTLQDFHHEFFTKIYPNLKSENTYDISTWYAGHGPQAKKFYLPLLLLFVRHAVLLENFVLQDKQESPFIKDIFLPAFIEVYKLTGHKPLVVAFEPTDIEGDKYWLCYPPEGKKIIATKLAC